MNRCLSCYESLGPGEVSWHRSCARRVFGTPTVPVLDLDLDRLEDLGLALLRSAGSVAGVQRKLSLDPAPRTPGRLVLWALGGRFLLKPPVPEFPYLPENEAFCMELARRLGLPAAPQGLLEHQGRRVYITRRFDRGPQGEKIPQEDFCQLSQRLSEDKYKGSLEAAGKVLGYSGQGGLDRVRFLELNLFAWLSGNADMHLKNFSLYKPGDQWILSPAYDLVSTALALQEDREETALTVQGKKARLTREDWRALGAHLGIPDKVFDGIIKGFHQKTPLVHRLTQQNPWPPEFQSQFLTRWNHRLGLLTPE